MMIPWNAEVIRSDDAVAICVFRKGNYQVEYYIEYPKMWIRKHSHPRMEVITMKLGGGKLSPKDSIMDTSRTWGSLSKKLNPGSYHGDNGGGFGHGFVTLAFQRWEDPAEMTSAAVQWKGELQGEWQAELINNVTSQDNPLYTLRPFLLERWSDEQITIPDLYLQARRPIISCEETLEALKESSIVCPPIDSQLLMTYTSYLVQTGFLSLA